MASFIEKLEWRNASKAFDPDKKVNDSDFQKVLHAIRMAPSSFGLQPYKIKVITDQATKEKIQAAAWNQPQVSQASHLLVFCTRTDLEKRTDQYMDLASGGNEEALKKLEGYKTMILAFTSKMDETTRRHWAHKQAYIALGFAHAACAELEIDSCPFEGFVPTEVDKVLDLPEDLKSCVLLGLGYRNPSVPVRNKVRFSDSELFG